MCYHDELREDFKFLYAALQKHPAILTDEQIKNCFARLYQARAGEVSSYESFINAATELTTFFQDGHTNIEVPYSEKDYCIPLPCDWNEDGSTLVLNREYEEIPADAQIMGINGITVEQLISLMAKRIPHENIYLVKSRMILYPYQNYHLFSEMSLKYLFGAKEAYTVSFKVNGSRQEKSLPLRKYNGFLDFTDDSNFLLMKYKETR